ncbi:prolyl oligopeptidase family serine peptidase [Salegentibacter sp. F14]
MKKNLLLFLFFIAFMPVLAQESDLSVEKIMQDPSWMGTFPENIQWGHNSRNIYFDYNPDTNPGDSLYKINVQNKYDIRKVGLEERRKMIPAAGDFNEKRTKKLVIKDENLAIVDLKSDNLTQLVDLPEKIEDPQFMANENLVTFISGNNAFLFNLKNAKLDQLTNIEKGNKKEEKSKDISEKDEWVQKENLELLRVVKQRKTKKEETEAHRKAVAKKEDYTFYLEERTISNLQVAPNAQFATFNLITRKRDKNTEVPNYVDESGYTVNLPARPKVGDEETNVELAIYNFKKDTVFILNTETLPGLEDLPNYTEDYPDRDWKELKREVIPSKAHFSDNGEKAVVNIRSKDNKDRWIVSINLENGELTNLDRQRDEAWIAGPGVGYAYYGGGTFGWLPDNKHIYFQSEETGYSHLYLLNVENGNKKALTSGEYEVFDPELSNDKNHWFLTTSEVGPGERHFYKMPLMGGKKEKLTQMPGNNEVHLSPDEKYMAIRHSYSNQPWELYLKRTGANAKAEKLTNGQSAEFKSYPWRVPEMIEFEAKDGAMVPARLYSPNAETKNNAAVVFVHGAGYLQNVHKWWSSYFREYMFHNLLTDLGYTVIDIDYRGSAGYGRDWRTGIYRHMGGKDLSDQVDGVKYLIEEHDINPEKVGIYGGSYGGFITLMGMFTEPETFKAGAALRSVTDWAHYNHGYTSNILNEPALDPIAYRRSSPIYFAEGLEGHLLIAHGMLDVNVHFQDVVRLAQRLIELGKEDWEMAVYPVEDHGFVEPSSWTDEYKRILELFNESLLK